MLFLGDVAKIAEAPSLHRATACYSLGCLKWSAGDRDAAASFFQEAIDIGSSATPEERELDETLLDLVDFFFFTEKSGRLLDGIQKQAGNYLNVFHSEGTPLPDELGIRMV